MKAKISSFIIICMVFINFNVNAQYQNGTNYGLDKSIDAHNRYSKPKKNKPYDFVKVSTESMVKELGLDGFQEAIVKTIFEDYKNAVTNINDEQIPDQGKYEKMQIEIDRLDNRIKDLLNKQQIEKFEAFKKKTSKKKKSKKDEKEESESEEK